MLGKLPSCKTGSEETLSKLQGCSPTPAVGAQPHRGAGTWLSRSGSTHLPAPWAGVCSERGDSGKEPPGDPAGLQQPPRRFHREPSDPHLERPAQHAGLRQGLPRAPTSRPTRTLSGSGSRVCGGCGLSPAGLGYSQAPADGGRLADEPRRGDPCRMDSTGAFFLRLPCL